MRFSFASSGRLLAIPFCALAIHCGSSQPEPQTVDPSPASDPVPTDTASDPAISAAIKDAVNAPDRSAEDRSLDRGRHPADMLAFFGIAPEMSVAELGAGTGYTTELLARVVGSQGRVFGQNSSLILTRFAETPWSQRLKKLVMAPVARVDREFDDPLPPAAAGLDAVLSILIYHDTVWMNVDRDAMNRAVYNALKPGGVYGVVDHSARAGRGAGDAQTLHRIEESVVKEEVQRAGFWLAEEGAFLRNPTDNRTWNASPMAAGELRGQSDRFVLKFVKRGG